MLYTPLHSVTISHKPVLGYDLSPEARCGTLSPHCSEAWAPGAPCICGFGSRLLSPCLVTDQRGRLCIPVHPSVVFYMNTSGFACFVSVTHFSHLKSMVPVMEQTASAQSEAWALSVMAVLPK